MKLQDKVCIVTGAASGIGKEVAIAYARNGGKVVIAGLNMDAAQIEGFPFSDWKEVASLI